MKRYLLILSAVILAGSCAKDESYFDYNLDDPHSMEQPVHILNKELYQYCLDSLDVNGDGYISVAEIIDVTSIDCHSRGMSSLEGIEIFPNLDTVICYDNNISELDLSPVPGLKYLDCSRNSLRELNVSMTAISTLYACPMDDARGQNLLKFLYVGQGQSIEYVTSNRKSASPKRLPDETVIIAVPLSKDDALASDLDPDGAAGSLQDFSIQDILGENVLAVDPDMLDTE